MRARVGMGTVSHPPISCAVALRLNSSAFAVVQFRGSESLRDRRIPSSSVSGVLCVSNLSSSFPEKSTAHKNTKQPSTCWHHLAPVPTTFLPRKTIPRQRTAAVTLSSTACIPLVPPASSTLPTLRSRKHSPKPTPKMYYLTPSGFEQLGVLVTVL